MAQHTCRFLFKLISILFLIQLHCYQGDSMKAAMNTVEPVIKEGTRRLHRVKSESKVHNWTAKSAICAISQCSVLCIPLVNSWPLANPQLNVTEQGLHLIKCLTLDLQLFCTARQLLSSAGCVLNYSSDILSTHVLIDRWGTIIDLQLMLSLVRRLKRE